MSNRMERTFLIYALLTIGSLNLARPAAADVVTDWSLRTVGFVTAANRPGPSGIIDLAMVHIAMHDAVQAYQHRFETYNEPIAGASGSPTLAVAAAARSVLVNRFPAQAVQIEIEYQQYLTLNQLLASDFGAAIGDEAARRIIERRVEDRAFPQNPEVFTGGTAPGQWQPTPPAFASMAAPWLGGVTPFALKEVPGLLNEAGPPHLSSGVYARDYNEVKAMGARFGSARTREQTDLAFFYGGSFLPQMNAIAGSVAIARLSDVGETARLLALANISSADAVILSWNKKHTYAFWRPSTAIVQGDFDGNPHTAGDPAWLPLINDPPYPDYTSGANSITSAFMRTLELFFGDDNCTFTVAAGQKERTYSRFSAVADDVVEARILLGIHFRFADVVGRRQAKQIADLAFGHLLRPVE
jgi:hypothetical protein